MDISLLEKQMNFKAFFKKKTVRFFIIVFATLLVLSNIVIFTLSMIQYNRTSKRQLDGYEEMMVHLITLEDIDTAITYTTHYYHTQGIRISLYDPSEQLIYQTEEAPREGELQPLYDRDNQIIAYIIFDDQHSYLGNEMTVGLIIINTFSILLFLVFLRTLYWYINASYGLLEDDLDMIGYKEEGFNFKDLEDVSKRLLHLINSEKMLRENQKAYIKTLAHDVKTPLTVIKAYLEGIEMNKLSFNEAVSQDISDEIKQIEKLIPKFMREDTGFDAKEQNIKPIIIHMIHRLQQMFITKHITIDHQLDDVNLNISTSDINRLVENLLVNAYHYSEADQDIIIELTQEQLLIKDQGIGMDEETLSKIKEGPYRSKEAFDHYKTGSGMGLQIVFEIVDRLGYQMDIISEVNKGTTIIIHF